MRILQTSVDEAVLKTRSLLLAATFPDAEIVDATSHLKVMEYCGVAPFDLVIIGQGIPVNEKLRLEQTIRVKCPQAKVAELYNNVPDTAADLRYPVQEGPGSLMAALRRLMGLPSADAASRS
jgi:hypothetical protein